MKVKIVNSSDNELPKYQTEGSVGMDLRAYIPTSAKIILPGTSVLVGTGLQISIPEGYEAQIRPRSGLALKHGITVLNTPGTIDSDYRGEIGVILYNSSKSAFALKGGDRIAQMVINKVEKIKLIEVEELDETKRGSGGFNSTGTK